MQDFETELQMRGQKVRLIAGATLCPEPTFETQRLIDRRREGRLHLHTIRSPRLDFFSRYPSRYRLILNTRLVLDLLDDIRPDIIESGDPYHLAWTALRAGAQLRAPVFGFYHSHFPEAYLRTAAKYGGADP